MRVAIKGDPFTVNKAMFRFYVNTKASRCMAFGPAVLPSVQVGQRVAMVLVAKDSTGKARTSGDDAIQVAVTSPSGSTEEVMALYLPYISPISPLHLPYISPISPLYLPYISPISPLYLP